MSCLPSGGCPLCQREYTTSWDNETLAELRAERDALAAKVRELEEDTAKTWQALGLLSTVVGSIEINVSDPVAMAREIVEGVDAIKEGMEEARILSTSNWGERERAEKAEAELAAVKERNAELEHTLSVAINRVKVLQLL